MQQTQARQGTNTSKTGNRHKQDRQQTRGRHCFSTQGLLFLRHAETANAIYKAHWMSFPESGIRGRSSDGPGLIPASRRFKKSSFDGYHQALYWLGPPKWRCFSTHGLFFWDKQRQQMLYIKHIEWLTLNQASVRGHLMTRGWFRHKRGQPFSVSGLFFFDRNRDPKMYSSFIKYVLDLWSH